MLSKLSTNSLFLFADLKAHFDECDECQRLQDEDPTNDLCPEAYRIIKISRTFEEPTVSVQ